MIWSQLARLAVAAHKRCYWTHTTSVYGMHSLFYNAAHKHTHTDISFLSPPHTSYTHLHCQIVCSHSHRSWIDHPWEKIHSVLFSARSGQKLLQNIPACLANFIFKILFGDRDIASDFQTTNHCCILCFSSYGSRYKRRCWPEESFYILSAVRRHW